MRKPVIRRLMSMLLVVLSLLALPDLHAAFFTPRARLAPELARELQVGDVVFTREPWLLVRKVGEASGSWTNHVGVVVDVSGPEPLVAESKFPRSVITPVSRFVARSEAGFVAVRRPVQPLSAAQQAVLREAAQARIGQWYDLGFNLDSGRQFCSKLVYESLLEATGVEVGERARFEELLASQPHADTGFWRLWYLGRIPWQRETVTPASQYRSVALNTIYDETLREPGPVVPAGPGTHVIERLSK